MPTSLLLCEPLGVLTPFSVAALDPCLALCLPHVRILGHSPLGDY